MNWKHQPTAPATGFPVNINSSRQGSPAIASTSSIPSMRLQLTFNVTNEYIFRNPFKDRILFCDKFSTLMLPSSKWQSTHSLIWFSHKLSELRNGNWFRNEIVFMRFRSKFRWNNLGSSWTLQSIDVISLFEKFADCTHVQIFVGSKLSDLWMQSQSIIWLSWVIRVPWTANCVNVLRIESK